MFFIGNCEINFEFFINSHVAYARERGIQIEQCANALIHDNTSERLGLSIKGAGSLLGTQFKCNTSDGSYYGFYFDAAYGTVQTALSSQGIATLPNDNKWYNQPGGYYNIDASAYAGLGIKWYYRYPGAQYYPSVNSGLITRISAGNPAQSSCTSCSGGMQMSAPSGSSLSTNAYDENEINGIINEINYYNELDESFKYFEKQYAYQTLGTNSTELNTQTLQFYYNLMNSNIGKFEEVYRSIETGNIDDAMLLNNQIVPSNYLEQYRKWINTVYFDYIVPKKTIPQNIIDDLENLASSSPFVNGDAVYTARAIVGYTENETGFNNKSREIIQNDTILQNSEVEIKVYPNPANDYIIVDIIGNTDKAIKFVITSTLGIRLLEEILYSNLNKIDVNQIKQGIYIYDASFVGTNESIIKGRLIINN